MDLVEDPPSPRNEATICIANMLHAYMTSALNSTTKKKKEFYDDRKNTASSFNKISLRLPPSVQHGASEAQSGKYGASIRSPKQSVPFRVVSIAR